VYRLLTAVILIAVVLWPGAGSAQSDALLSADQQCKAFYKQGKFSKAEPQCLKTLKLVETELGPAHHITAVVLGNLAELYRKQGRFAVAEPLLKRALFVLEAALGPSSPKVASILNRRTAGK